MNLQRVWLFYAVSLLFGVGLKDAAANPAPAAPIPDECHQFDFWLGEWDVTSPDGQHQGTNKIESVAGSRALSEQWAGNPAAGNGSGRSLTAWNSEKKAWQQFWIGSDGGVLELAGGLRGGSMILSGEHQSGENHLLERITWTPQSDGSVRQLWEQSSDAGTKWTIVFDGRYTKAKTKLASAGNRSRALLYLFW